MKKYILIVALLIISLTSVIAEMDIPGERMCLVTDRGLYVTGEKIHFSCTVLSHNTTFQFPSTIAYIELITPNGEKILGQKRMIQNGICKGYLTIPSEILTGNYYLRAYTKAMRNHPPETYGYSILKIINPERSEVLEYDNNHAGNHNNMLGDMNLSGTFHIEIEADTISTREEVQVKISKQDTLQGQLSHTVVSIVPVPARQHTMLAGFPDQDDTPGQGPFYPETSGITLSGTIQGQDRPGPVNITLLGAHHNNFYPVKTDSAGRFSFVFTKKTGEQDLFISFNDANPGAELLIDNDFCSKKTTLPGPPFVLNKKERDFLLQAAHFQKIDKVFGMTNGKESVTEIAPVGSGVGKQEKISSLLNQTADTVPFYGKPDHMVYVADYIQMSQLKDYLTELPVPVRIRKKGEEDMISIIGTQAEMQIFPPLLMVDFLPVYDAGSILRMNPEKVQRFDIIVSPYIRGEMTYGGILNVISNNNDFAGIKLPEKGLFLNYSLLTEQSIFDDRTEPLPSHIPDTRSTLYWNPSCDPGPSDTIRFCFRSSDMQGDFIIQVTGVTSTGEMLVSQKQFTVTQ